MKKQLRRVVGALLPLEGYLSVPDGSRVAPSYPVSLFVSRSVVESGAVLAVDCDVEACLINLHCHVDRDAKHFRPSRQHVLFLLQARSRRVQEY